MAWDAERPQREALPGAGIGKIVYHALFSLALIGVSIFLPRFNPTLYRFSKGTPLPSDLVWAREPVRADVGRLAPDRRH